MIALYILASSLVECKSGVQGARVSLDGMSNSNSNETESITLFDQLIGAKNSTAECTGYSNYDAFVGCHKVLSHFTEEKSGSSTPLHLFADAINVFTGKNETDVIDDVTALVSSYEDTINSVNNRLDQQTVGKVLRNAMRKGIFPTEEYDQIINGLYLTDVANSAKDNKFSTEFINFFLRRFNYFLETVSITQAPTSDDEDKLIKKVLTDSSVKYSYDLLNITDRYETAYYNDSVDLFNKIITNACYNSLLRTFTTKLLKQIDAATKSDKKNSKSTVKNVDSLKYYKSCLKFMLVKTVSISDSAVETTKTFLAGMSKCYFGIVNLYPGKYDRDFSENIQQVAFEIAATSIDESRLPRLLE